MVAPVTGPFTSSETYYQGPLWNGSGYKPVGLTRNRTWYRQTRPYDLPLSFDFVRKKMDSRYESSGPYGYWIGSSNLDNIDLIGPHLVGPDLESRSYAKLIASMGAAVQMGVATAEGHEAVSMITQRLGQMARFTRHIFTARFGLAAGDLGLDWTQLVKTKKIRLDKKFMKRLEVPDFKFTREGIRGLSQLFLEFHFGWKPLVGDIHDGLLTLCKPIKPHKIRGSATAWFKDPSNYYRASEDAGWFYYDTYDGQYKQTLTQIAYLIVDNPNLAAMQQWGVANPLSIAWELVPFSFVVDWFLTVGDFLSSLTDFAGVTLLYPQRTRFTRWTGTRVKISQAKQPTVNNSTSDSWQAEAQYCYRRSGIANGATIRLRTPKPWGIERGLAAVSLLMQRFPRRVVSDSAMHGNWKRTPFRENLFPEMYVHL